MKSLVLYGETRLGKTLWARSLGKHIYCGGLLSGKSVIDESRDAEYIIFDDMQGGMKFFHGWKNWFGCQLNFMVKQLYRDPKLITWGKPCIWVTNTDPREEMKCGGAGFTYEDIEWLEGNAVFIKVDKPLFFVPVEGSLGRESD